MKKKASLADLQVKKPALVATATVQAASDSTETAPLPAHEVSSPKKPHISVYLTPEALEQLIDLRYELRREPKELHREAFNLLFAKYGKPQIS